MFSLEMLLAAIGEASLADRLERLAYNALPATMTPDLWAHQYDRQLSGLLTLQDEIAGQITDAIQSSLGIQSPTRSAAAGPTPAADASYKA